MAISVELPTWAQNIWSSEEDLSANEDDPVLESASTSNSESSSLSEGESLLQLRVGTNPGTSGVSTRNS